MVQYFGEQLDGFAFTWYGRVQSYGSRYVRPPSSTARRRPAAPHDAALGDLRSGATERPVKRGCSPGRPRSSTGRCRPRRPAAGRRRDISPSLSGTRSPISTRPGIAVIQRRAGAAQGLPLRHTEQADDRAGGDLLPAAAAGVRQVPRVETHASDSEFAGDLRRDRRPRCRRAAHRARRLRSGATRGLPHRGLRQGDGSWCLRRPHPRMELTDQLQTILAVLQLTASGSIAG